ncbi:hypothetical protein ACI75Y_12840 [Capnocytophaga stomatis]|uniref:hypothetical protein n=1 Tax=Capnocytophaga stomatis TaxID=1848904 RepID=UPI00385A948F
MKLERIVTSLEISKKIKEINFCKKSIFSYYRNSLGNIYVAETNLKGKEDDFVCFCYTFSELLSFLPHSLDVNPDTYVVDGRTYRKIGKSDYAILDFIKIDEDDYVVKYAYEGSVIAFRQNSQGEYCNLLQFGKTEMDCLANIMLLLIEEEKM